MHSSLLASQIQAEVRAHQVTDPRDASLPTLRNMASIESFPSKDRTSEVAPATVFTAEAPAPAREPPPEPEPPTPPLPPRAPPQSPARPPVDRGERSLEI